ncbi:MAG: hypothetical protein PHI94_05135 [Eubacteriaceae bacterium]|nr:hypothetical protein [Eubacteriaceae bacterium]MDD4507872.1 hypothetical protein [Eubacteriaceae bacterium]
MMWAVLCFAVAIVALAVGILVLTGRYLPGFVKERLKDPGDQKQWIHTFVPVAFLLAVGMALQGWQSLQPGETLLFQGVITSILLVAVVLLGKLIKLIGPLGGGNDQESNQSKK